MQKKKKKNQEYLSVNGLRVICNIRVKVQTLKPLYSAVNVRDFLINKVLGSVHPVYVG